MRVQTPLILPPTDILISPNDTFSALYYLISCHDAGDQSGSVKSTLLKSMFEEHFPAIRAIQTSAATA